MTCTRSWSWTWRRGCNEVSIYKLPIYIQTMDWNLERRDGVLESGEKDKSGTIQCIIILRIDELHTSVSSSPFGSALETSVCAYSQTICLSQELNVDVISNVFSKSRILLVLRYQTITLTYHTNNMTHLGVVKAMPKPLLSCHSWSPTNTN